VFDDKEAVEELKSHGRHGEEVESDDHLVILEEDQPALAGVAPAVYTPEIPRHGPFRDLAASFKSSPSILGAPQAAFSSAIRRMSARISAVILGRPPCGRDRQRP
jgi:hypothetical protein